MTRKQWFRALLGGSALTGLLTWPVPEVNAGHFCGGPVVSAPIVSSYSSAPIVSSYSSYNTPVTVVERVVEKEIAPIAVPVVIPATVFQYMPALAAQPATAAAPAPCAHAQQAVAATPCQQAAAQTAVAAQTQVQTGAAATSTANIDQLIKTRLDAILKQYTTATTTTTGEGGSPATDAPDGPPPLQAEGPSQTQAPQTQAPQTQEPVQPQQTTTPDTRSSENVVGNWVVALRSNCAECHTQGKKTSGDVRLFDTNFQYAPNVAASQILDSIRSGRMPRGHKLDDATRLALLSVQAQ